MTAHPLDRRSLLKLGGSLGAATLAGINLQALAAAAATNRSEDSFAVLTPAQAATLDAMAARIIPTTDTPGAHEAGAVWFMDAVLGQDLAGARGLIATGITALDAAADGTFATLPPDRQDVLLRDIEDGDFFGLVLFMTLAGTLTMSRYGGNRGEVGWDLLDFERRHHWQPPFGHYDAPFHTEGDA